MMPVAPFSVAPLPASGKKNNVPPGLTLNEVFVEWRDLAKDSADPPAEETVTFGADSETKFFHVSVISFFISFGDKDGAYALPFVSHYYEIGEVKKTASGDWQFKLSASLRGEELETKWWARIGLQILCFK